MAAKGYTNPFIGPFSHLSARANTAGRAGNPRPSAFSGLSPLAGTRAAGDLDSGVDRFTSVHVPMLWEALMTEFRRDVEYRIGGNPDDAWVISVMWKEGAEDEDVSPGRYSHIQVLNEHLPAPPAVGDTVASGGAVYEVVRVDAYKYGASNVVLQNPTGGA